MLARESASLLSISLQRGRPGRRRTLAERYFNKIKHFRRVATRFDKLARNFLAAVLLDRPRLRRERTAITPATPKPGRASPVATAAEKVLGALEPFLAGGQ